MYSTAKAFDWVASVCPFFLARSWWRKDVSQGVPHAERKFSAFSRWNPLHRWHVFAVYAVDDIRAEIKSLLNRPVRRHGSESGAHSLADLTASLALTPRALLVCFRRSYPAV